MSRKILGESDMPDDPKKAGKPDRDRINVNEDHELRDWSNILGISPDR